MIEGVEVKPLKLLSDERGFLMELLRSDDDIFEQFGQVYVTGCRHGIAKAWHYHEIQTDYFACVSGRALVVLCDLRKGSTTRGQVQEFVLEAPPSTSNPPILLTIPPLVVHGFTALDCEEARIVNVPTQTYRYEDPDERRYAWNSTEVPYRWPEFVKAGG